MSDGRDDATLMRACARGDEGAFAVLHRRLAQRVTASLRRLTGSAADAEELAQEVFLLVWCEAAAYDPAAGPVEPWVLAIAHHRAVSLLRRRGAEERSRTLLRAGAPASGEDDLAERADLHRTLARCRRTMARLSPAQRETIRLAFDEGLSYPEIAAATGVPLNTVKSRVRLALGHLRFAVGEARA